MQQLQKIILLTLGAKVLISCFPHKEYSDIYIYIYIYVCMYVYVWMMDLHVNGGLLHATTP